MVVRNQTSEQPVKLRLDGYDTILLNVHGVFLADYLLQEAAERGTVTQVVVHRIWMSLPDSRSFGSTVNQAIVH